MAREHAFEITSTLRAPAEEVWRFVSRLEGVNHELWPLAQMTSPREARGLDIGAAPLGAPLFRSWVLFLGVLPVDYDDLMIARVDDGASGSFGFLETSTMLTQRTWRHERVIERDGVGCSVSDRLAFAPRVPALGVAFEAMFRLAFHNRHRRLRARFGAGV
jgi:ligand-binding SRPBCC domain-containing protein